MTKSKVKEVAVPLTSKEIFLNEYFTLAKASVGVVIVRTREPYRYLSALQEYSMDHKLQFAVWKISNGWNQYDMADIEAQPKADDETTPIGALRKIGATAKLPVDTKGFVYAMMWPHSFCNKNFALPEMTQLIAEYTKLFSEQRKRLVLVVPPEYSVPSELEDCVVMVDTDLPTQDELHEVYEDLVAYIRSIDKVVGIPAEDEPRILAAGAGMTVAEFENTIARAFHHFRATLDTLCVDDFVRFVSKTKAEIVKRSEVLELMPLGTMSDVGGLENLKDWIGVRKVAYDDAAREYGVDRPKGTALIGPPGTGKSLCAKAIAHELGLPLIRFDVSRVFNQFVGSSESRVREALKMCDAMAPCVVMLDEVDKAFDMNSGGGDSGVGKRILGAVLTHMQEGGKDIFWVMTANRVGGLPPELLRKGRLDEVFSVTLPNEAERRAILEIHLKKRKQDPAKIKGGLDTVVEACNGFVGAELEAAVAEAVLLAYAKKQELTAGLLCEQFAHVKPLSEAHAEQFQQMRDWAENNARPSSLGKPPAQVRERTRTTTAANTLGKRGRRMDVDDLDG